MKEILEKLKRGEITVEQAERLIREAMPSSAQANKNTHYVQSKETDDYEFSFHQHWRKQEGEPEWDEPMIKHFQDY